MYVCMYVLESLYFKLVTEENLTRYIREIKFSSAGFAKISVDLVKYCCLFLIRILNHVIKSTVQYL